MQTKTGETALMMAARAGFSRGVSFLFVGEKHIKDVNGWTALSHLVSGGKKIDNSPLFKMVWVLLPIDRNAIKIAIEEGNTQLFQLLALQSKDNFIHEALRNNCPGALDYYSRKEPVLDNDRNTILMTAIETKQSKFYNMFASQVNAQNGAGQTALMIAVQGFKEYEEIPEFLFEETGIFDFHMHNALDYAIIGNQKKIVRKLEKEALEIDRLGRSTAHRLGKK